MSIAPTLVRAARSVSPRSLFLCAGLFLIGCLAELTQPKATVGSIAVAPVFLRGATLSLVTFDRMRIHFALPGATTNFVDTTIAIAPGDSVIEIELSLPIGQTFEMRMAFVNASGDTVFRSGPDMVTASLTPAVVEPAVRYSGVGSNATGVRFATTAADAFFGDTVMFVAEAFDANGAAIPNTPIIYEHVTAADSVKARIPDAGIGRVIAREVRGPIQLRARLLTGQTAVASLLIQPEPSSMTLVSGNNQAATVGATLTQNVVARVLAVDGLGVQGIVVNFTLGGGGSLSQSADTSDAAGDVSIQWTLGTTAGSQTLTATVADLSTATTGATALAQPANASSLTFSTQPANTTAGTSIPIVITARDAHGNTATQFNANVALAITSGTGTAGAHLMGTTTVGAAGGVATFSSPSLDSVGTNYTITATTAGVPSAASAVFAVAPGAARRLAFTMQPTSAQAGTAFAPVVRVTVQDSLGNTVTSAADAIALAITSGTGSAGATLSGTATVSAATGVATFTGLSIERSGTGYTLTATSGSLQTAASLAFAIAPGPPASIAVNDGNGQSAQVASALGTSPSVVVRDAFTNGVPGVDVTFAIGGGGGSGTGLTQTTDADGIARVGSWTLGTIVGANALSASAAGVGGSVTFGASGTAGPPALFNVLAGDAQSAPVEAAVATAPSVQLTDAHGNVLEGVQVTFAVTSGGGSANGTTQTTNANGEVTVSGWTLGITPTVNTLTATAGAATRNINATSTWNRRLTAAQLTACAITSGGTTQCWGDNSGFMEYGVAPGTIPPSATPVTVPVPAIVDMGDGMGRHFCGITSSLSAVCWGRNGFGQLGGGSISGSAPVTVLGGISWAQLSMSVLSTCGISTTGEGYCWGSNQSGEVGSAAVALSAQTTSPSPIDGGLTFTRIAAGWQHACGLTTTGEAYCWGTNAFGILGNGATANERSPVLVAGGHRFVEISAGGRHTCAITESKEAYCWGFNGVGQLGDGTRTNRDVPTLVGGNHRFTNIVVGSGTIPGESSQQLGNSQTCALTEAGEPYCWGTNGFGELGVGTQTTQLVPTGVVGGLQLTGLTVGSQFACGMRGEAIWCWGWNDLGQIGDGTTFDILSPTSVVGGLSFNFVSSGTSHTCGIASGAAYCWGLNASGQLGDGVQRVISSSPVPVAGGLSFQALSVGGTHTCGLASGAAYCWGNGPALGNGTNTGSPTPVAVLGGLTFQSISVGNQHSCGITTTQAAYCWGANNSGQLGDGTQTATTSPVAVSGGLTLTAITAGNAHTCATTNTGVPYCWGNNTSGQLGEGTTTQQLVPTLVNGSLVLQFISTSIANPTHTCGVTNTGAAYCWGANSSGQIGDGTFTQRLIPTPVQGGITFAQVGTGAGFSCGFTPAGVAHCWGTNHVGQHGDGTRTAHLTPSLAAGGANYIAGSGRFTHSCAIAPGGAMFCTGSNGNGQLGTGVVARPPTRVTGF